MKRKCETKGCKKGGHSNPLSAGWNAYKCATCWKAYAAGIDAGKRIGEESVRDDLRRILQVPSEERVRPLFLGRLT